MADKKPQPYSKRRQSGKVVSGDSELKQEIPQELKPKKPEPSPPPKMETKNGKQWDIVRFGMYWKIQFSSGGQIPAVLSGIYTKQEHAEQAIAAYEAKKG